LKKALAVAAALGLSLSLAGAVQAQTPNGNATSTSRPSFTFFMTHYELLGDPNNPSGVYYHNNGHPFALAPDGSRVILRGKGSWEPQSGQVTGGGSYKIKAANGTLMSRGRWHVTKFVSFKMLPGWWGIPNFDEQHWQGPPGSSSFSGFLKVRVHLQGLGSGLLTAWCLMPTTPMPGDHISDGITLTGGPFNFNDYHGTEQSLEGMMFYGP